MALKNLFDMVKADRYTADGREELIKAQEAETEDATRRTYQIGEISEATGLQKTANGWVKPKNGKQPGAKKQEAGTKHPPMVMPKGMSPAEFMKAWEDDAKKNGFKKGQGNEWREHLRKEEAGSKPALSQTDGKGNKVEIKITESKGGGFYVDKYVNGKKVGINNANTRESAEAKAKSMMEQHMADPDYRAESKPERYDYRSAMEKNPTSAFDFKGAVSHSMPMSQTDYDELEGLSKFMKEEKATYQNALKSRAQALVDGHKSNGDWEPKKEQALMDIAKAVGFDKELHNFIAEENRGYDLGYSEDAAPSLSEIVDRVYNIGEISEKTGLQKTANGWRPVKKGAAGKTSRASKEEAIRKDLGLTAGEDMSRFSDEQIEKMYAKTQQTPEQQKADFDKSKIGQAVNKGRQEFAAEKTRQNELASKTNAIGLPKENNLSDIPDFKGMESGDYDKKLRAEGWTTGGWEGSGTHASAIFKKGDRTIRVNEGQPGKITSVQEISKPAAAPKLNQVEKVDGANRPYRIKGTQFYFDTPEEAETAIVAGTRGEGKTYAKPSSDATINEIQNALGFKLDSEYAGKYSMDDFMKKTGKDEYGVRVWSFGTDSKGTLIDTIVEGYNKPNATIKKENGEWRLHYTDRDGKKMIVTPKGREWPTSDSAPRQLTGDCRIRIRKEKPALTGDTKIRVRK